MRISAFMCQRKHWYLQRFVFPEMDNFLCGSVWDIPYDLAPGMVICGWAENHRRKPKQVSHTLTTDRKPTQLGFTNAPNVVFFSFWLGFFFAFLCYCFNFLERKYGIKWLQTHANILIDNLSKLGKLPYLFD